jgi:hypothetical protein
VIKFNYVYDEVHLVNQSEFLKVELITI